jgi:4-carboxymuconolactone decarboxylase
VARLPYVDPDQAAEPVRDVLRRVPPLNIFRMMANAETAFRPWIRWGNVLLSELALDPVLRELAILRVARRTPHAEYAWVQHVAIAKAVGAGDDQIAAIDRGEVESECLSEDQRLVLVFATEVVRDARASDATFERLSQRLSAREIVELLMVIGQYMMVARVMATTAIELDEPVGADGLGIGD